MDIRIILNGKKAALEPVREAIYRARENGRVDVRVTWEAGDVSRLLQEACADGCRRLVVGGGDGTINEIANAMMQLADDKRPELAVLPLGTANDFATACGIPAEPLAALRLAQTGQSYAIDVVQANDKHFINVASGGFGAEVTVNTPVALKNFLGGGAYTLTGLIQALNFVPYRGEMHIPELSLQDDVIVGAVCNGRQAGGGQMLAPHALINDGLMDVVGLRSFPVERLEQVINELIYFAEDGEFVKRYRVPWVEWESAMEMPINLDGEPIKSKKIRFEVLPDAINLVLSEKCPVIALSSL